MAELRAIGAEQQCLEVEVLHVYRGERPDLGGCLGRKESDRFVLLYRENDYPDHISHWELADDGRCVDVSVTREHFLEDGGIALYVRENPRPKR
jgi:hypothetical protein